MKQTAAREPAVMGRITLRKWLKVKPPGAVPLADDGFADSDRDQRENGHDVGDHLKELRRGAGHLRQAHRERRRRPEQ